MTQALAQRKTSAYTRGANVALSEYLKKANQEMKGLAGITYMSVMNSLHGGSQSLQSAFDDGVSALSFVRGTMQDFGLEEIKDKRPEDIASFNNAKVAIVEYSGAADDWKLGKAGTVYSVNDDGIAIMSPIRNSVTGKFCFRIVQHNGAQLTPEGDIMGSGEPGFVNNGFDIGDVVGFHERDLDQRRTQSMAM